MSEDRERQAELMEAAAGYAGRGLPVFPCQGKTPLTEHGFHDASMDAATVLTWWTRWPEANIGIPTGAVSGLDVLDVDVQHGGQGTLAELERKHGKLPATVEVLTPSGGRHHWFAHGRELKSTAGKLGSGVDTRGEGGYVLVPPSASENGRAYKFLHERERAELPAWVFELLEPNGSKPTAGKVTDVIPEGRRRQELLSLAGTLRRRGLADQEILAALEAVNENRCRPPLPAAELEGLARDVGRRYQPAEPLGEAGYTGPSRALADVVETFARWLHQPDPGALYAVLAAVAANRVDGDPLWLQLVGPSGGGKTELLAAVTGLPDAYPAATLTEAALLSGTPRKEHAQGASGGLLREVGEFGLLICKDFGSVLSQHRDARAAVLAALRELFDGAWTRRLGTDGGKTLTWEGKLGLLAGCTPAIDQHHAVLAALGERFLWYRLAVEDAAEQARRSLEHAGRERQMRTELADAVRGLFAGLDFGAARPLDHEDRERLIALAMLVVRCRSAVLRDSYSSREIELVPDSEAPGRLVGVLGRFLVALRLIGVPNDDAWRVTVKAGLDSMPALRWQALRHLLDTAAPEKTSAVAAACDLPTNTARRVLEDLAAHGVLDRYPGGEGKADTWKAADWARERYARATVPEMSETCSKEREHVEYDISGTVARGDA